MHSREAVFSVPTAPEAVWRFIRDFESLCACVPGVERLHRVDDATAEMTIVEKIGVVPLRVDFTAHIDEEDPPRSLHAVAKAEHVDVEINVRLRATGQGTELASQVSVIGRGPLKAVVDRLFERRATERTAEFAQLLESRFGTNPKPEDVSAPPPKKGKLTRVRLWLLALFGFK